MLVQGLLNLSTFSVALHAAHVPQPDFGFVRGRGCGTGQAIRVIEEGDPFATADGPLPECTLIKDRKLFSQIDIGPGEPFLPTTKWALIFAMVSSYKGREIQHYLE